MMRCRESDCLCIVFVYKAVFIYGCIYAVCVVFEVFVGVAINVFVLRSGECR